MSNFWKNRRVLITGHTGFKGTWLCLWLKKLGANISGMSLMNPVSIPCMFSILDMKQTINDYRGDIISPEFCLKTLNQTEPEIIFHMAAQSLVRKSYTDPINTFNTNIIGTANILQAVRECDSVKTVVVITSDKCYENIEKRYAYVETDPLGGYDPYSSSKACAEHVVSAYYRSFFKGKGLGLATARAGNVIGGGDWSSHRIIPDAVSAWSKNKKLIIRNPQAIRPWQHVLEPLSGYISLAENLSEQAGDFSGAWNFGPDQNSVNTVFEVIQLASREWYGFSEWEFSDDSSLHEASLLQLNSEKARSLLSWQSRIDFDKAVYNTIRWYKQYYINNQELKTFTFNQIEEYEGESVHH